MRKVAYYVTLPFFTAVFYLMLVLEGGYWVVRYPHDAWNFVKRALGMIE